MPYYLPSTLTDADPKTVAHHVYIGDEWTRRAQFVARLVAERGDDEDTLRMIIKETEWSLPPFPSLMGYPMPLWEETILKAFRHMLYRYRGEEDVPPPSVVKEQMKAYDLYVKRIALFGIHLADAQTLVDEFGVDGVDWETGEPIL